MTYQTVPVNFVGGENQSRSNYWSAQSSVNFYTDYQQSGRSPSALLPWPGEKAFSSASGSISRGMTLHNNLVYLVADQELVEIDSAGTRTSRGTIPGTGRCSFASDGTNLIIRNGLNTYQYNTSLTTVTDSDLENAQTVAYINNQMVYQGLSARFGVSDAGTPHVINALNYATAESQGDDLVEVYSFNDNVYLGGERSIEAWYNSGVGTPPFDRINQSTIRDGVASPFSMANSESFLYYMSNDGLVKRMSAFQPENITPSSIAKEFRQSTLGDAQGYVVKLDGQNFYIVQLPTSNKTFAVSEQSGEWFKLSSGVNGDRHLMNGYVYAFNKHLVADYNSGDVYEWDFDTHESNYTTLIRQRDSAPINGLLLGVPGSRLMMKRFELIMETGVGNSDIENPRVMISGSIDGGRSWFNEDWIEIGRTGESVQRVEWYDTRTFYDLMIRVRVSDPAFIGIHGAAIDIRSAGH